MQYHRRRLMNALIKITNNIREEQDARRSLTILLTILTIFQGAAALVVWPAIRALLQGTQTAAFLPPGICWFLPASAAWTLTATLALPEKMYRPAKCAVGCCFFNTFCALLILLLQPLSEQFMASVSLRMIRAFTCLTLSGWLAMLPTFLGTALGILIRWLWIAVFRGDHHA